MIFLTIFRSLLATVVFLASSSVLAAENEQDLIYLGKYSSVKKSPLTSECDGYTVKFWELSGSRQLIGTIAREDGNCETLGTPIYGAMMNSKNQAIEFFAPGTLPNILPNERFHFSGKLLKEKVMDGTLTTFSKLKGLKAEVEVSSVTRIQLNYIPKE